VSAYDYLRSSWLLGTEPRVDRDTRHATRDTVSHYCSGDYECIDVMRAISTRDEFVAFCRLTAIKYLWRLGKKDDPARELKKAEDYMRWARERLEEG